jgi:glucose-1-phosphate thymidylyltransferase
MKALITAGGRGTRLRPLTHTSNKHLVPIANKPMIHYALEAVTGVGITDIGIVLGPETADEMRRALGTGERWGGRITWVIQDAPRGLAHAVQVSRDFLGDAPFLFYLGDNLLADDLGRFLRAFESEGSDCHLVLARVPDPARFGVAVVEDGRIVRVVEKPQPPPSPYAVTGIYLYRPCVFEAIARLRPSARGELEISEAHQALLERGRRITFSEVESWWKDTGKPEDILEANRLVLDQLLLREGSRIEGQVDSATDIAGRVLVEAGARLEASQVRGPAVIGAGATVAGSYIGPFTAVGPRCEVRNSEVEFSILLEGARVLDAEVRIERSVLGREVVIRKGEARPRTQKFILGDQSLVELP